MIGYHGGSTMMHLGRPGRLHPVSLTSLRAALMDGGDLRLWALDESDWADPAAPDRKPPMRPHPGWTWRQPTTTVAGPTWGGNLEIAHWNLAADRWFGPVEDYHRARRRR